MFGGKLHARARRPHRQYVEMKMWLVRHARRAVCPGSLRRRVGLLLRRTPGGAARLVNFFDLISIKDYSIDTKILFVRFLRIYEFLFINI